MKFGMQLRYGNISGFFQGFLIILIFWFVLFFQKTDTFLAPRTTWTICRSSMKLCMLLHYGITSGNFQGFFKNFDFFAVFRKKQITIFGPTCHLNDLSQVYETWCAASLCKYLGIFSRIFWTFWIFFDFCCFSKKKI